MGNIITASMFFVSDQNITIVSFCLQDVESKTEGCMWYPCILQYLTPLAGITDKPSCTCDCKFLCRPQHTVLLLAVHGIIWTCSSSSHNTSLFIFEFQHRQSQSKVQFTRRPLRYQQKNVDFPVLQTELGELGACALFEKSLEHGWQLEAVIAFIASLKC